MAASDFEQEMNAEIKRRVDIIESPDYDFGVKFSKSNAIGVAIIFVVCLIAIMIV